jgi:hypothetical protein
LEWHRDLERLREGFKDDGWKLCYRHLEVRYLCLWRSGGKALSSAAEEELNALADRLRPQTGRTVASSRLHALVRVKNPDWHLPLLNIRWTTNRGRRKGLPRLLHVTAAEEQALEKMKQERQPKPQPSPRAQKQAWRRIEVERLRRALSRQGVKPSLRRIQSELKKIGVSASIWAIASDLDAL